MSSSTNELLVVTVEPPSASSPTEPGDADEQPARPAIEPFVSFPVDALPEPLRTYVKLAASALGCDESYIALPLLAALASAIGNSRQIQLKRSWHEPAIVWACIIGESGTLKTPAFRLAMRSIRRRQERLLKQDSEAMKRYESNMQRHEAELAAWKTAAKKTPSLPPGEPPAEPKEPRKSRCIVSDATVEALAPLLLANPRGVLQSRDELGGWIGGFDRYSGGKGGGDVSNWLSMFNGEPIIVDRKTGTQTIYVPRASVSIVGGFQPATLRRLLGDEHRENGLAARLLMAWPPRRLKQWTEQGIDAELELEVDRVFDGLFAMKLVVDAEGVPQPRAIGLTTRAKATWIRYYDDHAQEQIELSGDEAAAWSKLEGYAARLALVVHQVRAAAGDSTLESADAVDEVSVEAGVTLSRWFGTEALRVYAMLRESEAGEARRKLVELIERKGGRVTGRDLMRSSRRFSTAEEAERALADLEKAAYGKWEHVTAGPKGGRPSKLFVLADSKGAV